MFGMFGQTEFGSTWYVDQEPSLIRDIALVGDTSDHNGVILTSNQDGSFLVAGGEVAVQGALHSCPIPGHGITSITAVTTKTYHNGKLIITTEASAGCGAKILALSRGVIVE